MTTPETSTITNQETASFLARIAKEVIVAYAWVSGPALSQQQRVQQDLAEARRIERELDALTGGV